MAVFFSIPRTKIPLAVLGVVGVVWFTMGISKKKTEASQGMYLEIFGYIMSVTVEPFSFAKRSCV